MKQFTIEVRHASPGQLQTIAAELKTMSNGWAKHGPQIVINKQQKKFTLEVKHASPGQLQTIGLVRTTMAGQIRMMLDGSWVKLSQTWR